MSLSITKLTHYANFDQPGHEVINFISCSTEIYHDILTAQKSKLLIIKDFSCFLTLTCSTYHA